MAALLIGADVGGSTTRAAIARADTSTVEGMAERPGGNPNVVGTAVAAQRIRAAITEALADAADIGTAADVVSVVLGMSGYATARSTSGFGDACCPDGIAVTPRIVSDFAVAYSSATSQPHGYVIVAGTGAGAAEIVDAEIVTRRDGWGWLLGDQGSGFWIGREAVRSCLHELEAVHHLQPMTGGAARSLLCAHVLDWFDAADLNGLLQAVYQAPPRALADLTPVVAGLADTDTGAAQICRQAGDLLADLVQGLHPDPGRPIVAGGSVLHRISRVRSALGHRLPRSGHDTTTLATSAQHSCNEPATPQPSRILEATSGLLGALWVAAGTGPDGAALAGPVSVPERHRALATSFAEFGDAARR